jgi:hypothetical protein
VEVHGPEAVAALALSHADCEDLADRIRARLIDAGRIAGPSLAGPGWGRGADRHYAAGDRVLLHTKSGHPGLHNGSAGTVTSVADDGLGVAFDGAGEAWLVAGFVAGRRGDGNPNVSHAWARTIDSAQGGTWEAVHLLGTANLDALVGYTGQSRGRAPTHTWNARPLAGVDHGGVAADDRSATEAVLAGLSRQPVTTFAATDDPFVLDARLRAERAGHVEALAAAPPDRADELAAAQAIAGRTRRLYDAALDEAVRAVERLRRLGPLTGLRRASRHERADAEASLARARERAGSLRVAQRIDDERLAELAAAQEGRSAYLAHHGWRSSRIASIDAELDRHWAAATLAATRQDDPLAFGVGALRAARAHYAGRLGALDGATSASGGEAGDVRREVADALAELDAALDHTRAARVRALATEPPRHLVDVLGPPPAGGAGRAAWCGLALGVEAYRDRHPEALGPGDGGVVGAIGPRPSSRWQPEPEWDGLARRLADGPAVVSVATELGGRCDVHADSPLSWLAAADDARGALEAVRSSPRCPPELLPERGRHAGRGMSLGL